MSNYHIVGSYALVLQNYGISHSDIDIWYSDQKPKIDKYVSVPVDYKKMPQHILDYFTSFNPTIDELYTIKCSHLGWSNPKWSKHKHHALMMKKNGAQLIPDFYEALKQYWETELGDKSFLSLDKNKEKFFQDHVNYLFDHDELHLEVASPKLPVYISALKDNNEVLLCKEKFNSLSISQKHKMFEEEIITIALERWMLNPYWIKKGISIDKAHSLSVQKTITNLTKNWACDYIIQNLEIFSSPNYATYYKVINKFLDSKQKEKYMKNKKTIEFLQQSLNELNLNFPEYPLELDSFIYQACEGHLSSDKKKFLNYTHLTQDGGGEGGAEDCYGVFQIGDKIFKAEYFYQSYNGHQIDNIQNTVREVAPKERTIIVYE